MQEYARVFASAGARGIILVARKLEPLEELKAELNAKFPKTDVLVVCGSVSSGTDVERIYTEAIARFVNIDIVISNVGAQTEKVTIEESDSDKWWEDFVSSL